MARACWWLVCKRSVKTSIRPHRTPQHANRPPAIVVRSRPVSGQLGLLAPHAVPRRTLNAHSCVPKAKIKQTHTEHLCSLLKNTRRRSLSPNSPLIMHHTEKNHKGGGGMTAHAWSQLNRPPTSFYLYPHSNCRVVVCLCVPCARVSLSLTPRAAHTIPAPSCRDHPSSYCVQLIAAAAAAAAPGRRCWTTLQRFFGAEQIGQCPVDSMHCCRQLLWK